MRPAGRRQRLPRDPALFVAQGRKDMALIEPRRRRAIEADESDAGVRVEKGLKVVRDRIIGDVRIETSRTSRGR